MRTLKYLFILMLALSQIVLVAQTPNRLQITTSVPVTGLNVCGNSQNFTLTLKNNNPDPALMTNLAITVVMPEGVVLDATGSYGDAVFLGYQNNNPSRPQFSLDQLAHQQTAQITYSARAKCGIITTIRDLFPNNSVPLVKNFTSVAYKIGTDLFNESEFQGSGSYNILISDISLGIDEIYTSIEVNVGDDVDRKIRILNKGTGFLTKLKLIVKYPATTLIEQRNIKIGTTTLIPLSVEAPNTITYEITDFSMAVNNSGSNGDPARFEPDERMVVDEVVRLKQCAILSFTDFKVQWGCDNDICNFTQTEDAGNATFGSYLSTPAGTPSISGVSTLLASTDLCGNGIGETEFVHTNDASPDNSGRNRANNIRIFARIAGNFRQNDLASPIADIKLYVRNTSNPATGSYVSFSAIFSSMDWWGGGYWHVDLNNNAATLNTDIDGPGGLTDLDKDGYFDDLPVGESIKTRMKTEIICPNNTCAAPGFVHYYYGITYDFTNGCGNQRTGSPDPLNYLMIYNVGSTEINGPEEMVSGQTETFVFKPRIYHAMNSDLPGFLNCSLSDNNYSSKITLPDGYNLVAGTLKWNNVVLLTNQYSQTGQELTINIGGNGDYSLTLQFNCGSSPVPEINTIHWEMFYRCSMSCTTCDYKIICQDYDVYNYCLGEGTCNSYATNSFNLERKSLGWEETGDGMITYDQWKTLPKVTSATPGIYLNRAMSYDTIQALVKGKLVSGTYTYSHLTLQYVSRLLDNTGQHFNLFDFLKGDVYVNGVKCTAALAAPTVTILPHSDIERMVILEFKFPTADCGITAGAEVDYDIRFRVKKFNRFDAADLYPLNRFRAAMKGGNDGINSEGCNSKSSKMELYVADYSELGADAFLSCKGMDANGWLRYHTGYFDRFPNEFRPIVSIRKFSVPKDPLLVYQSGSTRFEFYHWCCSITPKSTFNPNASTSTHYIWDFSQQSNFSGRYVGEPNFINTNILATFTRTCANKDYTPANYMYDLEYEKYIYTRNPAFIEIVSASAPQYVQEVSKANLTLVPEALQEGYKSTVQWKVTIQNPGTAERRANADRTWLAIEPTVPGIAITGATYNGVTLTVRPYGGNKAMLELGTVLLDNTYELIISATYSNCVENQIDAVNLIAGWACSNKPYPLTPAQADCYNATVSSQLFIRYKNTDLGHEFSRIPPLPGIVSVCTPLTYQSVLSSTGYGDLSNLVFKVELSEGINYIPNSATYTYEGITLPLALPSASANGRTYTWNLSSMAPLYNPAQQGNPQGIGTGVLPGERLPGKEVIIINFQAEAKCGIDAGEANVRMIASARTNCGDDRIIGHDDKLSIEGLTPLDKMRVTVNCNLFDSENLANISATATNIGTSILGQDLPLVSRYLTITLPQGIVYEPSSASQGEPVKNTTLSNGNNVYWWLLPALSPNAPGNSFPLAFKIRRQNFNVSVSGNQIVVTAATVMLANNIFCASENTNCEVKATTAKSSCAIKVQTKQCESCNGAFAPEADKKYVISAWVREGSYFNTTTIATTYQKAAISLFFGGADVTIGPFYPKGEIIDGWQRIEEVFTIPANITTVEVRLTNSYSVSSSAHSQIYFDDLRIHPFNSNMKSFVYDPFTLRLSAELDENNYATFYEYDQEGGLVRVKKETEKGIMTIQESRSNNVKK